MLAGLATRRHRAASEPVGEAVDAEARSSSKSSVSRRFVARTKKALAELMARDLSGFEVAALMIDGVHFAEHCCVVALAICADGTKVPVGLWLGDTENKTVVTNLLADLADRGLSADGGLLVVIDGAKALAAAVRQVSASSPSSSAAPCTSAATSPTICRSTSAAGSISGSPERSTTPTPPPACTKPGNSPVNSRPAGPTPPPACAKGSRRCSPFAASASATGSPAVSRAPT